MLKSEQGSDILSGLKEAKDGSLLRILHLLLQGATEPFLECSETLSLGWVFLSLIRAFNLIWLNPGPLHCSLLRSGPQHNAFTLCYGFPKAKPGPHPRILPCSVGLKIGKIWIVPGPSLSGVGLPLPLPNVTPK